MAFGIILLINTRHSRRHNTDHSSVNRIVVSVRADVSAITLLSAHTWIVLNHLTLFTLFSQYSSILAACQALLNLNDYPVLNHATSIPAMGFRIMWSLNVDRTILRLIATKQTGLVVRHLFTRSNRFFQGFFRLKIPTRIHLDYLSGKLR